MQCPEEGTFIELVRGHPWTPEQCVTREHLDPKDPQPMLLSITLSCGDCRARLELWCTKELSLHKGEFAIWEDPDATLYFRRSGTNLDATGEDEYVFGWGDETAGLCYVWATLRGPSR